MSTEPHDWALPRDQFDNGGFTAIEHAAIALKVPTSGTDWLDDMIRESRIADAAAMIFAADIAANENHSIGPYAAYAREAAAVLVE
jgi:fructose-specific phosphotransferase system component IIB